MKTFFFRNLTKITELIAKVKVDFIQRVPMHMSFPQTDKPYYFPELEF